MSPLAQASAYRPAVPTSLTSLARAGTASKLLVRMLGKSGAICSGGWSFPGEHAAVWILPGGGTVFSADLRRTLLASLVVGLLLVSTADAVELMYDLEFTVGATSTTPVTSLNVSAGSSFTIYMWLVETTTNPVTSPFDLAGGLYQTGGQLQYASPSTSGGTLAASGFSLTGLALNNGFTGNPPGPQYYASSPVTTPPGYEYLGGLVTGSPIFQSAKGVAGVTAYAPNDGSVVTVGNTVNGNPVGGAGFNGSSNEYGIEVSSFTFTASGTVGNQLTLQGIPLGSDGVHKSGNFWNISGPGESGGGNDVIGDSNLNLLDPLISATSANSTITISAVPEPKIWASLLVLLVMGIAALVWHRRRCAEPAGGHSPQSQDFYTED